MKRARTLPTIWIVLLATGLSRDAQAIDTKVYPGTFCRQVGGAGDTSPNGPFLGNISTSPIVVSCPVLRDDALSVLGWTSVEVYVRDASMAAAVECWSFTRHPNGTLLFIDSESTGVGETTPGESLWQTLSLAGGGPNSAVPNGTYGVACSLPAGVGNGVGGYRVVEP